MEKMLRSLGDQRNAEGIPFMSYKHRAISELQNKYETIKIRYNNSYLPLSGAGRAQRRGPAGPWPPRGGLVGWGRAL